MGEIRTMIETRAGRTIQRMADDLEGQVEAVLQGFAKDLELVYQSVAPKGPATRLARGVSAVRVGVLTFEIQSTATDPITGYHYTGVTRLGHKQMFITPKQRSSASVISTRGARAHGRRAALRIVLPTGEVIFRSKVKAYKPDIDWADKGHEIAQQEAQTVARTLGNKVISNFS